MNFLAHIYLSQGHEKLMIGNFIGDFVKGNQLEDFDYEIKQGIILHRLIDEYTDSHPVVLKSKVRLRSKYRHYSGVIVDMYYDHFLAKHWSDYHHAPLERYSQSVYKQLMKHRHLLPKRAQHMLPFMIKHDWLLNYSTLEGISKALYGMSQRTKFDSKMNESVADLQLHYDKYGEEFKTFFDDLISFTNDWISSEVN